MALNRPCACFLGLMGAGIVQVRVLGSRARGFVELTPSPDSYPGCSAERDQSQCVTFQPCPSTRS